MKRILDIYTRNTPSDVLSASGVCGDTYVSVYGEGGKGSLRIGGGGGASFMVTNSLSLLCTL